MPFLALLDPSLTSRRRDPILIIMSSPRRYAFAFYYYGFPAPGRGWRRMRD